MEMEVIGGEVLCINSNKNAVVRITSLKAMFMSMLLCMDE